MKMTRKWVAKSTPNFMVNVTLRMWKQNWIDYGYYLQSVNVFVLYVFEKHKNKCWFCLVGYQLQRVKWKLGISIKFLENISLGLGL
jgi:hypothetical protein